MSNEELKDEINLKVCIGCGHFSDMKINKPHLSCCPDNKPIPVKQFSQEIFKLYIKQGKDWSNSRKEVTQLKKRIEEMKKFGC